MTTKKKTSAKVPVVLSRLPDGPREYHGIMGQYIVQRVLVRVAYPRSGTRTTQRSNTSGL